MEGNVLRYPRPVYGTFRLSNIIVYIAELISMVIKHMEVVKYGYRKDSNIRRTES